MLSLALHWRLSGEVCLRTFKAKLLSCSILQLAAAFFYCYVSKEFLPADEPLIAFFAAGFFRFDYWRFLGEEAGDYSAVLPLVAWKLI